MKRSEYETELRVLYKEAKKTGCLDFAYTLLEKLRVIDAEVKEKEHE